MINELAKNIIKDRGYSKYQGSLELQAMTHISNYCYHTATRATDDRYSFSPHQEIDKLNLSRITLILENPHTEKLLLEACMKLLLMNSLQEIL